MRVALLALALALAGCGGDAVGVAPDHPLTWFVGSTVGLALLSVAFWFAMSALNRWDRRDDRQDRRGERRDNPKS